MTERPYDHTHLRDLLPERMLGAIKSVTPIQMGLSGAGVYSISSERGEFVLRVQGERKDHTLWTQQLAVLRAAADHGIAPRIVYLNEDARAVIQERVAGLPLPAALGNPTQRGPAMASVISQLRALHAIDLYGISERDPVVYGRSVLAAQRGRAGFPLWAAAADIVLDDAAALLARDRRRVLSHNDVNPGNVLWDGTKAWLIDWEVAGRSHPYYDLAAFTTFLNLDAETANGLLAVYEGGAVDAEAAQTLAMLRRLVAVLIGCTFLGLVPELSAELPASAEQAPSLAECYAQMRAGTLSLQSPEGQTAFGLALLRLGTVGA